MAMQLLFNALVYGCLYALIGVGMNLFFLGSRFLNAGYGCVFLASAYGFLAARRSGYGFLLAVLFSVFCALLLTLLQDWYLFRFLRKRLASSAVELLASLALLILVQNVVSLLFGDQPWALTGPNLSSHLTLAGLRIERVQLFTAATSVLAILCVLLVFAFSRVGLAMRAVAQDPELGLLFGIRETQIRLYASALGALATVPAALLVGFDRLVSPGMGFQAVLLGLVTLILGGVGSFRGAVLAGFLLAFVRQVAFWKLPTQWGEAATFLLLVAFLLIRPQGFLGSPLKRVKV